MSFSQEKDSLDQYSYEDLTEKFQKVRYTDTQSAKIYLTKILDIVKATNDTEKTAQLFLKYSNLEKELGNYENAIHYIKKADSCAKKLNNKVLEVKCEYREGNINYSFGNYEKAFELYIASYNYYKNVKQNKWSNGISHNMALIRNALDDYNGALKILLKNYETYKNSSIKIRNSDYSPRFYANTLIAISDAYTRKAIKNPKYKKVLLDSASIYNLLGYKISHESNDIVGNSYFTAGKGIINYRRGKPSKALKELDEAIQKINISKEYNLFTSVYYYKGLAFKQLQQMDSAIVYLEKTDSISTKNSLNYITLQHTYYTLASIYKQKKDLPNFSKYFDLHTKNDSINDRLTKTVRDHIHNEYDIDILQEEIKNLNNEIEDKSSKATIIISLLIVVLCGFFIFYYYQKRKNKASFEKIVQQLDSKKKAEALPLKIKKSLPITIDDEKVVQVLKALEKFEEKEWFRNKNSDLAFVAKKAKTNKTYLSKIIHTHKQLKFIDYIRNLRIDYALERLKDDPVFRSYDIKSIAEESGFKSSDLFSRAFVKNTGIYPSYYIKNINKIKE